MHTTLTSKGQATIPKDVRDALRLDAGVPVAFAVNDAGDLVLRPALKELAKPKSKRQDRFEAARGIATIKWRTDTLMAFLRSDD